MAKCPVNQISVKFSNFIDKPKSFLSELNFLGMRYLGKFWIFQYFGAIYPDVIPHFYDGTFLDKVLWGQKRNLHKMMMIERKTAYEYFLESGIDKFGKRNNGICTFRVGLTSVIYQTTNVAIVKDKWVDPNRSTNLFGDFIGTMPTDSKVRKKKRAVIESILGNIYLMKSLKPEFEKHTTSVLNKFDNNSVCLEKFCRILVADISSITSGIFDFNINPLSSYLEEFKSITVDFFDLVSDSFNGFDKTADKKFASICRFVRILLKDNFTSIANAPEGNIIKRYFKIWQIPFTLDEINKLHDDYLREIGTIIILIYDATSLSLSWVISYIEQNALIKKLVIKEAKEGKRFEKCSYIDLVVLEALRLAGSAPTVLFKRVSEKFELEVGFNKIVVLPGTILLLNRRSANQDSEVFIDPQQFNPTNIEKIMKDKNEDISSLLSKHRYEINSFNAINTQDNARKCPGRIYSVYIQSLIIQVIYKEYKVRIEDNNTNLKKFSSMPRLLSPGTIRINNIKRSKNR